MNKRQQNETDYHEGIVKRLARLQEIQNRRTEQYRALRRFYGTDIPRPRLWRAKRWLRYRVSRTRYRLANWIEPK